MDQPEGSGFDEAIERVLDRADREWRRMRVTGADRTALRADLRRELVGAAADGVSPDELLGPDIGRFARELAASAGMRPVPFALGRLLLAGLIGAVPGLVLAWFLAWRWWTVPFPLDDGPGEPSQFWRYTACVLVFLLGVLIGISRGLRGDPALDRTLAAVAVAVPVAGVLAIPVTMGFASLAGYRTSPPVFLAEVAIVGAALAGGAVLARRWAVMPVLRHSGTPS
jgi:hypothetical protein